MLKIGQEIVQQTCDTLIYKYLVKNGHFDKLKTKQWPCNIIGCYLSKYLEVPRSALKVFELLARSVLYTSGIFQGEESQNRKKLDLNYLQAKLKRPRLIILRRNADLNAPKAEKVRDLQLMNIWSLVMLEHVLAQKFQKR